MKAKEEFIGSTILNVEGAEKDSEEIIFTTTKGIFKMYHRQYCCERVSVDDIIGADYLIGSVVLDFIEKVDDTMDAKGSYNEESHTWTFYTIRTSKGYTDIKWYGESNGYYSETVNFEKVD